MSSRGRVAMLVCVLALAAPLPGATSTRVLILTGLGGEAGFAETFASQADGLGAAFAGLDAEVEQLGADSARREQVQARLAAAARELGPADRLVLAYVGHGSYDGRSFRFNVPGPDFTAAEVDAWLDSVPAWQLIVLASSASGAALGVLVDERRTVMTATRSGDQSNVTVFGHYLVEALGSEAADVNKDRLLSAQEAFDYAQAAVAAHYEERRLMATEHPQLNNPRSLFVLASLNPSPTSDPALASLVADRERVEAAIESLKKRKVELGQEAYFAELQQLLLELALIEQQLADDGGAGR